MIVAIAGKIGSGKSTLSEIIKQAGFNVVNTDNIVHDFYETHEGIKYVLDLFPEVVITGQIDRDILLNSLLEYHDKRVILEDYIVDKLIVPIILTARQKKETIYIDGVLPKYFFWFDQVIYIERFENRKTDVKRDRQINFEQFNKIEALQVNYPKLFSHHDFFDKP